MLEELIFEVWFVLGKNHYKAPNILAYCQAKNHVPVIGLRYTSLRMLAGVLLYQLILLYQQLIHVDAGIKPLLGGKVEMGV